MKNPELTEKEIEIFTFFHQNQNKDFQLDFLCETFGCSETLILDCIKMWKTMVKQSNQEFSESQKSKKPMQLNLI
jgi:predicted DNA-binding protein YlxM (UPF0122 family)